MMSLYDTLRANQCLLFFTALTFWVILYHLLRFILATLRISRSLPPLIQLYIAESAVSSVQGFLCGGMGVIGLLKCRHDVLKDTYDPLVFYCTFGAGYFAYDIVAMYYSNYMMMKLAGNDLTFVNVLGKYLCNHALMVAHHIILVGLLFPALMTYSSMGHFFVSCFFIMELSSPLVNIRVVLSKMDKKRTTIYVVNGVTMMFLFAFCRVFIFPYMYVTYCIQIMSLRSFTILQALSTIPLRCHVCCLVVLMPQLYWLSLMVRGVAAVITRQPKIIDKLD